jgi:hypothetical protein
MKATLTIIKYKKWAIPFAFISMGLFKIPFFFNKKVQFHKLMGTGRNGTFDIIPDVKQWAFLTCQHDDTNQFISNQYLEDLFGVFIMKWLKIFSVDFYVLLLEPINGHGLWDKKAVFGTNNINEDPKGQIATLTRATIRLSKLPHFWKNVPAVSSKMKEANGLVFSIGIGEIPWIKQATFSIWESLDDMKQFAYKMKEHNEVIKRTRTEKWYAEEMFFRFKIIDNFGTINGINPLKK